MTFTSIGVGLRCGPRDAGIKSSQSRRLIRDRVESTLLWLTVAAVTSSFSIYTRLKGRRFKSSSVSDANYSSNCVSKMEVKQAHVLISSERREREREWGRERREEQSGAAGDDGGNHGDEDGGQTEEQGDVSRRRKKRGFTCSWAMGSEGAWFDS